MPNSKNFGDGLIFCNKIDSKNGEINFDLTKSCKPRFLNNLFYFCIWNRFSAKIFNYFFLNYYHYFKKSVYKDNFNNVMFPYLGKEFYFSSFGNMGFFESQFLVAYEKIESFIKKNCSECCFGKKVVLTNNKSKSLFL